jgi:hypothetical protein
MMNEKLHECKNFFISRIIFIPFYFAKLLLITIKPFGFFRSKNTFKLKTKIAIEAGEAGWELIELKELYQSACEYLSESQITKVIINRKKNYLKQILFSKSIKDHTHYVYDPRTGSQTFIIGFIESLIVAIYFQSHNVIPIAILTDLPLRRWRMQVAIVTACRGVTVCLMSPKDIGKIFPHKRLIGPSLMPFSIKTAEIILGNVQNQNKDFKIIFSGSIYEPRETILKAVQNGVINAGFEFEILGRILGEPRSSEFEYWNRLSNVEMVFTTAEQMFQPGTDFAEIPHLIYRYLEVLICGAVLVAPEVPGIRRYFNPGEHFLSFSNPEDAIDVIIDAFRDRKLRNVISKNGQEKAMALVESKIYWSLINSALGKDAIL